MTTKKVKLNKIKDGLKNLSDDYLVFTPQSIDETIKFAEFLNKSNIILDKDTDFSCKDILYPQRETLFNYNRSKGEVELTDIEMPDERILVFGLRPCDLSAIESLVPLFTWGGYDDDFWLRRKENLITVVILCDDKLRDTCFCRSVGVDPSQSETADIVALLVGDDIIMKSQTDGGDGVLKVFKGEKTEWKKVVYKEDEESIPIAGKEDVLFENFDNELWKWIAPECIGCGICTFVCPTCYCFDIQDEGDERVRFWDYCTGEIFSRMMAHQPRPTQYRRYRQRIMHKFSYYPRIFDGIISCVGCGRCIDLCPQNIDLREVLRKVTNLL